MKVKELMELLSGFNSESSVHLLTLNGGICFEARECGPNGRCGVQHVELSTKDVPEEWLGDEIIKQADKNVNTDREECFKQGETANDHNRRICRIQFGERIDCPYVHGTDQAKWWNDGYQYRDMVNDG